MQGQIYEVYDPSYVFGEKSIFITLRWKAERERDDLKRENHYPYLINEEKEDLEDYIVVDGTYLQVGEGNDYKGIEGAYDYISDFVEGAAGNVDFMTGNWKYLNLKVREISKFIKGILFGFK